MARRSWLAVVGILVAGGAATAAPTVPPAALAAPVVVRVARLPTIDFTHLFNRLTVPLGTVPVID